MKNHTIHCIALKIYRWHNFEMAEITIYACSGNAGNQVIFNKLFVA